MNLIFCLIVGVVDAAPIEAYPLVSDVSLAPSGVTRVSLPPELVGAAPGSLGRTLRVQNGDGVEVPFAVLLSTQNPEATSVSLDIRPAAPTLWVIEAADRPVDTIEFDVSRFQDWPGFWLTVSTADWSSGRTFIYEGDFEGAPFSSTSIDVGHRPGPFTVSVDTADGRPERIWDVTGYVRASAYTPPRVEVVTAEEPVLTEAGTARWTVRLPGPRSVTSLRVVADGDVYRRDVRVGVPGAGVAPYLTEVGSIRRLQVGEAHVDQDRLPVTIVGDTLLVDIDTDRGVPLPVVRFEVESVGAELVVRDPGPGPHVILGGTYDADQAHDLGYAAVELLRGDTLETVAPAPAANPAYVPLPTREGVDGVGAAVNLARFHFARAIEGPVGWVTLPLDTTVLAHARADLGDLRVVDREGRGVPFLLRSVGAEVPTEVIGFTRSEKGTHSQIHVPLAAADAPVAALSLHTPSGRFQRSISVLRDRGRMTEPVRTVQWNSEAKGSTLSISLYEHFGRDLLVDVDNGDNPPLPIDRIVTTSPAWEVRTRVPEGGARLIYGSAGERAPQWDLTLLEEEVWRMPLALATLGEETATGGPGLSALEKLVVAGAIGLLALGLVGMTVRALRPMDPAPTA